MATTTAAAVSTPTDVRDKGVIGMAAFRREQPQQSEVVEYVAPSGLEYATEWGKLSEEQRRERLMEMRRLRGETEKLVGFARAGRPVVAVLLVAAVGFIRAKQAGLLPRFVEALLTKRNVIIAFVLALVAFVYPSRAKHPINVNPKNSPTFHPFVGMVDAQIKLLDCFHLFFLEADRKNGFQTWELAGMEGLRVIVLNHPLDRKHVLKDNWRNYLKNVDGPGIITLQDMFCELMGRGIFSTDKKEWQDHRKVASSMFSIQGLQTKMEHVFKAHTEKLVQLLAPLAGSGKVVDLQNIFQCFTFDTICEIAFGTSPNSLDAGVRGEKEPFLVAFDTVQTNSATRGFEPKFLWEFKKWLGIGSESVLYNAVVYMDQYVVKIIKERRQSGEFETKDDLLSLYIQFARKSGQAYMEEDAYLRDVILNFMIAGRDTTACTLTNIFKCVGTSSSGADVTKRVVKEFKARHPNEKDVNWESLKDLTFGDAVFNETLRMYPPVSSDFRLAEKDDVLPGSGFQIKKGMRAFISCLSISRNPDLWSHPDEFLPDRWVQKNPQTGALAPIKRPDEYVFPVFWGGPRLCLGKDMARFEAKLVASVLMSRYRFEVLPHEEKYVTGPVIFYTKGLPVRIHLAETVA